MINVFEEYKNMIPWTRLELIYFNVNRTIFLEIEPSLMMHRRNLDNNPFTRVVQNHVENVPRDDIVVFATTPGISNFNLNTAKSRNKIYDSALTAVNTQVKSSKTNSKILPSSQNSTLWLGDTGASCHMTNSDAGMYDIENIVTNVTVGDGRVMKTRKIGKKKLLATDINGNKMEIILDHCKYIPELHVNLFSLSQAMSSGWNITTKQKTLFITKNTTTFAFNDNYTTQTGFVPGIVLDTCHLILETKSIDINQAHKIFGHPNENTLKQTAITNNITLTGTLQPCETCLIAKARQSNIPKFTDSKSQKPGERLCIDVSSVNSTKQHVTKFWLLIVDECTDYCWTYFMKHKSDLQHLVFDFVKKLLLNKYEVKYIRCDNDPSHFVLKRLFEENNIKIQFEFVAPNTPQHNGKVERKFATLYAKVRTMLLEAGFNEQLRNRLWIYAATTATEIENHLITQYKQISSFKQFFPDKESIDLTKLKVFGSIGIVARLVGKNVTSKLEDRGMPAIYLGRAIDHTCDTYKFYNMKTQSDFLSRDVRWLRKLYGEWVQGKKSISFKNEIEKHHVFEPDEPASQGLLEIINDEIEENEVIEQQIQNEDIIESDEETEDNDLENNNLTNYGSNAVTKLTTFYNPEPTEILNNDSGRVTRSGKNIDPYLDDDISDLDDVNFSMLAENEFHDIICAALDLDPNSFKDRFEIPANFKAAWDHADPFQREKWREAVNKELGKMAEMKVFKIVKRKNIPSNKRCVKYRWVFDIKRNGTFRARLVACGYSQIPGIDFTDSFSPVTNDVTFRILLIYAILFKLDIRLIDIETAFLHGLLDEQIYMDCPQGMECSEEECVLLLKALYGLVQSARQFYKKFREVLLSIGFTASNVEPCLFSFKDDNGIAFLAIHVDDCITIGNAKTIDNIIRLLESKDLKTKVDPTFKDYLGCEVTFNKNRTKVLMSQPSLFNKMQKNFAHLITGGRMFKTPGTPNHNIIRPVNLDEQISEELQSEYRSVVGSLLYLIKYSRPDIANTVRELAKCMDKATVAAYKEMKRVLQFVFQTKDYGLILEPTNFNSDDIVWDMKVFTDSDWAGDKECRRSVTGFIIYFMGAPIFWKSRLQKTVALSSTEAEYYALSEAGKEIKFVIMLLQSMGIELKLPVIINVDNVGAIFMSENQSATARTRHVDARYHFIQEMITDNLIKIIFVKTANNDADIFTKNVTQEIYDRNVNKYMITKEKFEYSNGIP